MSGREREREECVRERERESVCECECESERVRECQHTIAYSISHVSKAVCIMNLRKAVRESERT